MHKCLLVRPHARKSLMLDTRSQPRTILTQRVRCLMRSSALRKVYSIKYREAPALFARSRRAVSVRCPRGGGAASRILIRHARDSTVIHHRDQNPSEQRSRTAAFPPPMPPLHPPTFLLLGCKRRSWSSAAWSSSRLLGFGQIANNMISPAANQEMCAEGA